MITICKNKNTTSIKTLSIVIVNYFIKQRIRVSDDPCPLPASRDNAHAKMANRALFHAVLAVTDLIDGRRRLGGDSVFGTRNALRARVRLYPAAVSDAEKRGQSLAGDYRDDCAVADRSAAECIEYLHVQRALRLDAGFERLRVLDVCSNERRRGVDTGV